MMMRRSGCVFEWCERFKICGQDVKDDKRTGWHRMWKFVCADR